MKFSDSIKEEIMNEIMLGLIILAVLFWGISLIHQVPLHKHLRDLSGTPEDDPPVKSGVAKVVIFFIFVFIWLGAIALFIRLNFF